MKFSLINVNSDGRTGYWIVNHIGTIDSAKAKAKTTNAVNSNKLNIAVVDELPNTTPMLDLIQMENRYVY